jgi:predicted RND superfamily exporter protein
MVGAAIAEAVALSETGAISGDDLADLVMRRLNYQGAAYYEVPYDPAHYPAQTREELSNLIAQYLLLYSGELDEFADDALEPRQARMRVQLRTTGNIFTQQLIPEIEAFVAQEFPPGYTVEIAGIALVEQAITELITGAQVRSIAVSIVLVFLIVAITFRSLVAGLYGVIPLALTLLVNFGVMGFAGIKLDITTAMVASIAIGIGIDYTIHFLSSYHIERRRSASLEDVELRVLSTTGKAIVFNAVSVAAGFAVLVFSQFNPLAFMGALIALTMLTSSIASMTLLPVLLDVFKPKFMQPRTGGEQGGNQ